MYPLKPLVVFSTWGAGEGGTVPINVHSKAAIQILQGLNIGIKTAIGTVGWSCDPCEGRIRAQYVLHLKEEYHPDQAITTTLECEPSIARCSGFYAKSPKYQIFATDLKTLHIPTLISPRKT